MAILPFIEQETLYNEFRLDEAWDSPHNRRLLSRMPRLYELPGRKKAMIPPYHTLCQVFVGKGAAFEGTRGLKLPEDFPDGTSNTLLVVEMGEPVPWSKPQDLAYDPDGPLPELRCYFRDVYRVGLADGSVRNLRKGVSADTWRAAITRNGGDHLGPDW